MRLRKGKAISSTLSLKRHSRVPPLNVGVTDEKFLAGPVMGVTTQKASRSTMVVAPRRWCLRKSTTVCGTKQMAGPATCHACEDL
jgi:hypothetical protein